MSTQYFVILKTFSWKAVNSVILLFTYSDFWNGVIVLPFETPFDDLLDTTVIWLANLELEVPE